ncbi:MAG: DoxX family protein [Acidimicrobiia bacterium]
MDKALWVAQFVAGAFFVFVGVNHFTLPPGLPDQLAWMYELSPTAHAIIGVAEILGGLGLILPAVTRVLPQLIPLAAAGLAILMLGAVVYHVGRGEYLNVASNLVWVAVLGFIAYGRWKVHPISPRVPAA